MISNEPTNHLGKPDACPDGFYEVMSGCWETDPMARPTFAYISKEVSQVSFRWLVMVYSIFQLLYFDGPTLPLFISSCYTTAIKQMPNHWKISCGFLFFSHLMVTIATVLATCKKHP